MQLPQPSLPKPCRLHPVPRQRQKTTLKTPLCVRQGALPRLRRTLFLKRAWQHNSQGPRWTGSWDLAAEMKKAHPTSHGQSPKHHLYVFGVSVSLCLWMGVALYKGDL